MSDFFASVLSRIHAEKPLIHVISNYVTLNDVVNIILAAGGTAIAADDPAEAEEITGIAQGLYLNSGMPSERKLEAMILAGRQANRRRIPVVLDPVGAGASALRKQFLTRLLSEVQVTCIRGNAAEIAALSGMTFSSRGVESADVMEPEIMMRQLAGQLGCILAVSGEEDLVVTQDIVLRSQTGSSLAKRITGSGCMLSGLLALFLAAGSCNDSEGTGTNDEAVVTNDTAGTTPITSADICCGQAQLVCEVMRQYGLAQEQAQRIVQEKQGGTMTFRNELIDTVYRWSEQGKQANCERRTGDG